jgi:cell division septal protein FtsQ
MYKKKYKKASLRIAKRSKLKKISSLSLKIGAPIAVIIGMIFLLRADFLQVRNLAVLGADTVPQGNIKTAIQNYISGNKFFVIPKSDIFFINKNGLATALLAQFPRLQSVEINKQFFDKGLEIAVAERSADFLWCSVSSQCYFMNKSGLVFEKSNNNSDKIIFTGVLSGNPIMKNFVSGVEMQNYIKLIEVFANAHFQITSINVEAGDKTVVKINAGDIIFNPEDGDLTSAAQNAILLINQIIGKAPSAKFNYIDTRFGNKMFYKLTN